MSYNLLNFTFTNYKKYVYDLAAGLETISSDKNISKLLLRGPAGLFKQIEKHPLCWGLLNECNANINNCPLDIITYHRKGNGMLNVDDIIIDTKELFEMFREKYPKLMTKKFSNTEADPISGWSKPLNSYSNLDYAIILMEIVFEHWNLQFQSEHNIPTIESISHDNAFLSYYPYEFYQRTVLTRFQMNLTIPKHVQFIQKPVYAALGLLSSLGNLSTMYKKMNNNDISFISSLSLTHSGFYGCVIILKSKELSNYYDGNNRIIIIKLKLPSQHTKNYRIKYFVEYLENNVTDPVQIWKYYGSPAYPNNTVRLAMRNAQVINILYSIFPIKMKFIFLIYIVHTYIRIKVCIHAIKDLLLLTRTAIHFDLYYDARRYGTMFI